ncbi:MAG: zf-TFIIB domain-containing protein [Kiritimatiellaeota bacterium]|nr:zf-TFIIB domain-containing protein [Kiritimatiellota bacterium]
MKNCPHCHIPLTPMDYTGFNVLHCDQCKGYLVDVSRLETIKRLARKEQAELKAEVRAEYQGDTPAPVKCPKCHLPMQKKPVQLPGLMLQLDECKECALLWLDGGEIALVQLEPRTLPIYSDMQDMKRRSAALETDPERKAAFERNLAKLPDEADPFEDDLYANNYGWAAELVLDLAKHLVR